MCPRCQKNTTGHKRKDQLQSCFRDDCTGSKDITSYPTGNTICTRCKAVRTSPCRHARPKDTNAVQLDRHAEERANGTRKLRDEKYKMKKQAEREEAEREEAEKKGSKDDSGEGTSGQKHCFLISNKQ